MEGALLAAPPCTTHCLTDTLAHTQHTQDGKALMQGKGNIEEWASLVV